MNKRNNVHEGKGVWLFLLARLSAFPEDEGLERQALGQCIRDDGVADSAAAGQAEEGEPRALREPRQSLLCSVAGATVLSAIRDARPRPKNGRLEVYW